MTQGIGGGTIITVFNGNARTTQGIVFCVFDRTRYLAPDQEEVKQECGQQEQLSHNP
jgi:hypothetical protein